MAPQSVFLLLSSVGMNLRLLNIAEIDEKVEKIEKSGRNGL
jgi:hypothetical protein